MSKQRKLVHFGVAAAVTSAALVAGCGGDSNNMSTPPPATSQVPSSASASVDGFIAYLKLLVASSADTLEPVDTSMVTAPVDDTTEPQPVP